jgi:hypothetical protein
VGESENLCRSFGIATPAWSRRAGSIRAFGGDYRGYDSALSMDLRRISSAEVFNDTCRVDRTRLDAAKTSITLVVYLIYLARSSVQRHDLYVWQLARGIFTPLLCLAS